MVVTPSGNGNLSTKGGHKKSNSTTMDSNEKSSRSVRCPPASCHCLGDSPVDTRDLIQSTSNSSKLLVAAFPSPRRHSMPKMKTGKVANRSEKSEPSSRKTSSVSSSSVPVFQDAGKKRRCPSEVPKKVRIPSPAEKVGPTPGKIVRKATPPPLLGTLPVSPVRIRISPQSPETPAMSPGEFRRYELRRLMDIFIHAATSSHCSCAANLKIVEAKCGTDPETEVSWDDLERRCTDFGISDYLSTSLELGSCSGSETIEENLEFIVDSDSGDPSLHWLTATPPQRFSDPDLDNIEPLPVTLDTLLNTDTVRSDRVTETEVFENEPKGGDDLSVLNLDDFRHPSKLARSSSRDEMGLGPQNIHSAAKCCPRRLSRQISLPSQLFADLYIKSKEKGPLAINFRLNRKESLSESYKLRLLNQLESLSMTSSMEEDLGSPTGFSMNSSWESSVFSRKESADPNVKILDNQPPFTSGLERKAILIRNMRRLVRQDTLGNFAPPDFCI